MAVIKMWVGDTAPKLETVLYEDEGVPLNLVTYPASAIKLVINKDTPVERDMTIADAANGAIEYTWVADDTSEAGLFDIYIKVTFDSGEILKFTEDKGDLDQLKVISTTTC